MRFLPPRLLIHRIKAESLCTEWPETTQQDHSGARLRTSQRSNPYRARKRDPLCPGAPTKDRLLEQAWPHLQRSRQGLKPRVHLAGCRLGGRGDQPHEEGSRKGHREGQSKAKPLR